MGWQEIIVAAIGIAAAAVIVRRVVCAFRNKGRKNPCCGCGKTCPMRSAGQRK